MKRGIGIIAVVLLGWGTAWAASVNYTVSGWGPTQYSGPFPPPPGAPHLSYPGDTVQIQAYTGSLTLTPGTYTQKINTLLWTVDWTYNGTDCSVSNDGPPPLDWPGMLSPINAARTMSFGAGPGEASTLNQTGLLTTDWFDDWLTVYAGSTSTFFVPGYAIKVTPNVLPARDVWYWNGNPPCIQPSQDVMATFEVIAVPSGSLVLVPDKACYQVGDTVTVHLWMYDVPQAIVGGQFFLQYDTGRLAFGSATATAPFSQLYLTFPSAGLIDYAVQIPPTASVTGDAEIAVLTFTATAQLCAQTGLITWRVHDPPSRLSDGQGQPVVSLLAALDVVDTVPPVITCPADITIECNESKLPAHTGVATASDNCDAAAVVTYSDGANLCNCGLYTGKIVRTWTATDACGNASHCVQTITVVDTTPPVISPTAVTWNFTNAADYYVDGDWGTPPLFVNYVPVITALPGGGSAYVPPRPWINEDDDPPYGSDWAAVFARVSTQAYHVRLRDITGGGFTVTGMNHPNAVYGSLYLSPTGGGGTTVLILLSPLARAGSGGDYTYTFDLTTHADYRTRTPPGNWSAYDPARSGTFGQIIGMLSANTDYAAFWGSQIGMSNTSETTFTITQIQLDARAAESLTVECDGSGNAAQLSAWLAGHGGASATDNCGTVTWSDNFTGLSDLCCATGAATVTFTARDDCGNFSTTTATFAIVDTTPPTITTAASDVTVECDGSGNTTQLNAWLNSHGGAAATDVCCGTDITWTYTPNPAALSDQCCATGTMEVTFKATDGCGSFSTTTATFTVVDTTPPTISGCPSNISVHADAGGCSAVVRWTEPTASDVCCGAIPYTTRSHAPGSSFPGGTTTVTYTFADGCGRTATCSFDVIVDAYNEMAVSVELSPTMAAGPITRCITFELWTCAPTPVKVISDQVLTFTNGLAGGTVLVPCGDYECITARDSRHTLRRTQTAAEGFGIVGTQYAADFTGDPDSGGDWLIGGNLNDDFWIDILDFGVFSWQWSTNYGSGNTDCNTPYPHADINGNGLVGPTLADFTFIQINFLKSHEANCCGAAGFRDGEGSAGPVTSVTVAELRQRGLGHLVVADLNGDGVVDQADIAAFMAGARPHATHEVPADATPLEQQVDDVSLAPVERP